MDDFVSQLKLDIQALFEAQGWQSEDILPGYTVHSKESIWHADFLLLYRLNPLAAVEVLPTQRLNLGNSENVTKMLHNARQANSGDVPFVFFTDGSLIFESDLESGRLHERAIFPSPEELWERLTKSEEPVAADPRLELVQGYSSKSGIRAHQAFAISRTLNALIRGQHQVLISMAVGSGISTVQLLLAMKLLNSGFKKRLLFISYRKGLLEDQFARFPMTVAQEAKIGSLEDLVAWLEVETPEQRDVKRIFGATTSLVGSTPESAKLAARLRNLPRGAVDLIFLDLGFGQSGFIYEEVAKSIQNVQTVGFISNTIDNNLVRPAGTPTYEYTFEEALVDEEPKAPPGYKAVRLGDLAEFRTGVYIKSEILRGLTTDSVPAGVEGVVEEAALIVKARDIQPNGVLSLDQSRSIPYSVLREALPLRSFANEPLDKRHLLQENDIVLVAQGRIGRVALVPREISHKALLASSLIRLRIQPGFSARDVFAFLKSDVGQASLRNLSLRGTSVPRLKVGVLEQLQVFLPVNAKASNDTTQLSDKVSKKISKPVDNWLDSASTNSADSQSSDILTIEHVQRDHNETQDPLLTAVSAAQRRIKEDILPLLNTTEEVWPTSDLGQENIALAAQLLHQVADTLSPPSLSDRVTTDFPAPIALAFKRFQDGRFNAYERVLRLKDLAEATSFFLYNVLLADAIRNLDSSRYFIDNKRARRAYNGYSMSSRLDFIEEILTIGSAHDNGSDLFLPELVEVKDVVKLARFLQEDLRNRISHTAAASESQQLRLIDEFEPAIYNMLEQIDFLRNYRLVRVTSFYYRDSQLIRQMVVYRGTTPTLDELAIEAEFLSPMERDHLILLSPDDQVLDLFPIYQLYSGEETRYENHLCFLKQSKKEARLLEGESALGAFIVELDGFDVFDTLQNRLLETRP